LGGDVEPRAAERVRPDQGRGRAEGESQLEVGEASEQARDVFSRHLDLPRGTARERVRVNTRHYELSGDDVRTLATVGSFRVVPAKELRDSNSRTPTRPSRNLERLRDEGLVKTIPYLVGRDRTTLVTLTERGRAVLEVRRRSASGEPRQAFYAGISKPRELAHDARVHAAYLRASERLVERGASIRRVVLEEELKADYQRFLQRGNRGRRDGGGMPESNREAIERWARERELPYQDGHVEFPDARIEYEDRDGRQRMEDLEVVTPHYRGAHAAAKARAGFTQYRANGARVGGVSGSGRSGRAVDPRLAEELLL
jgi:DNA-binding MarR family transcriptional regulator